jgi:hypothetical protein
LLPHFADARSLIVSIPQTSLIERIDLATGARTPIAKYATAVPPSCVYITPAVTCADGAGYAYTYVTASSDLFSITGLR